MRGDVIELYPAYEKFAYRIEMFGDEIEKIEMINPLNSETLSRMSQIFIYPAVHYVLPEERVEVATNNILEELDLRVKQFKRLGKLLEAQRNWLEPNMTWK